MRKLCGVLGTITLILGFLGSAALAYFFGETATMGKTSMHYERSWGSTIGIFFGCFLAFFILSIILFAIAEILNRLEMLSGEQEPPQIEIASGGHEFKVFADGKWSCPNCGTINSAYSDTCKCGQNKPD